MEGDWVDLYGRPPCPFPGCLARKPTRVCLTKFPWSFVSQVLLLRLPLAGRAGVNSKLAKPLGKPVLNWFATRHGARADVGTEEQLQTVVSGKDMKREPYLTPKPHNDILQIGSHQP